MKLYIQVKSNSSKGPLVEKGNDNNLIIYVKEPAIDGKANTAIIELLSKHLNTPKTSIQITKGHKSKYKTVEINR